jgi:hypothetical protein
VHPKQNPEDFHVLRQDGAKQWVKASDVQSGFSEKDYVVHQPPYGPGRSLGFGQILASKTEIGLTQFLGSSFKCNTSGPLGIGCCDGQTKQAPQ